MSALSSVRKAVIPAAGLGTRHFPASHAVMKELFPVVGPDGISRALIHYHLIELAAAGIEEICIIVQPGDDLTLRRSGLLGTQIATTCGLHGEVKWRRSWLDLDRGIRSRLEKAFGGGGASSAHGSVESCCSISVLGILVCAGMRSKS